MRIGIVGSGHIGGTLAQLWARVGHHVAICHASGPETLAPLIAEIGPLARASTLVEAVAYSDVVLLGIPWGKYQTLPAAQLAGKIVIDAMNYYPQRDGHVDMSGMTSSELVASHLSHSRLVKAFNTMHYQTLATAGLPGAPMEERLALFLASDDAGAKALVQRLIEEIGFAAVDTGSLRRGSQRQQPGSPLYNRPMRLGEARETLSRTG